jgi:3-deoxy-D-manno-octulosonic-acid transferase
VRVAGNLKADAPPLPVDEVALAKFRQAIGTRPVFLAASTHPGEEQMVLDGAMAGALTIIAPRHAERGAEIESLAQARGFTAIRRRNAAMPSSDAAVYVADTMGELGLFYRLARVAFLGGSLVPHGGQNPLEAARLGVPVIAGAQTGNFDDIYRVLFAAQGVGRIQSGDDLKVLATKLLRDSGEAARIGRLAQSAAENMAGALAVTLHTAEQLLANARA